MMDVYFNGQSLLELCDVIEGKGAFNKPDSVYRFYEVPNHNGLIYSPRDRFSNVKIVYRVLIKENFEERYSELINFLHSVDSYARLENSLETSVYRMALFRSAVIPDVKGQYAYSWIELAFDCMPQEFYKSGDEFTQLEINPQGNLWQGSMSINLDGINVTNNGGFYIMSGYKGDSLPINYHENVTIPAAGRWRIRATISVPEYNLIGQHAEIGINQQYLPLNRYGQINTTITTTGASNVVFTIRFESGYFGGTIDAQFNIIMTKDTETTTLANPSLRESKPLFIYENVGSATNIYINGVQAISYNPPSSADDSDGTLYIDCELMDCYLLKPNNSVVLYNGYVTLANDFPVLTAGSNGLYTTHGKVQVAPRWWRL